VDTTADAIPAMLREIWAALDEESSPEWTMTGAGGLPSAFPVTEIATAAIAAAGAAVASLTGARTGTTPSVRVDRRLASLWFLASIRPEGWRVPPVWDAVAGVYPSADGWIRLHTNAPHHRAVAEQVLGAGGTREEVGEAVRAWQAEPLERAIVDAGGCAAAMRSVAEWDRHVQGRAVAQEPLVDLERFEHPASPAGMGSAERPLAGVRVLDLTRVLAGPVATRFLAGYGARVLRIDPPDWDEPPVVPEVTLGKRCARLDARTEAGRETLARLIRDADVLVHGYRPGALERLGFGLDVRRGLNPGLVDVTLDAYGWTGPWRERRGFDSLVQMSSGIAEAGMRWAAADRPTPLPCQALDHATGYLMAAAAVLGLKEREVGEGALHAKTSLARTARLLLDHERAGGAPGQGLEPESSEDLAPGVEATAWGPARRLRPPLEVGRAELRWDYPAEPLGASAAAWP